MDVPDKLGFPSILWAELNIAFDPASYVALLALVAGDSVAISGSITPKVWIDRESQVRPALDMVAQQVMTAYQLTHKRQAVQE